MEPTAGRGLSTDSHPGVGTEDVLMRSSPFALVALALLAILVFAPVASAKGDPYTRALSRVDNALRFAVERQPEGLAKSLATSERVCELGQGAEAAGDRAAAEADWSTLSQVVTQLDEPGLAAVERAFGRVGTTLGAVEARFSRGWRGQPERVRELHRAARLVRGGLRRLGTGFEHLRGAFLAWREQRCEAALAAVASFSESIPEAMAAVNFGMWRLLALATPRR